MNTPPENDVPLSAMPPLAYDEFRRQMGVSKVTLWRLRKKGWLKTENILGHLYVTREEVAAFVRRLKAGEFSKHSPTPSSPKPKRHESRNRN